jgi:hypothetical protein
MTTCHQVRQKYPATSAGKTANGSKSFATKIAKVTFKANSGIALFASSTALCCHPQHTQWH